MGVLVRTGIIEEVLGVVRESEGFVCLLGIFKTERSPRGISLKR